MFCWKCGKENEEIALHCVHCGVQIKPAATGGIEDIPGMHLVLPVGCSGWAVAAGYLGLFAVTGVLAPFAIVAGILALRDLKRNPKKRGKGRAIFGIVMGILGTALAAFMALLAVRN